MKARLTKPILMLIGAFLSFSAFNTQAAIFTEIVPPDSIITYGAITIEYSPSPANNVWIADKDDVGSQNEANIESVLETELSTGDLTLVESNSFSSSVDKSVSFAVASDFRYVAIHAGDYEFVFHYDPAKSGGTTFTITTTGTAVGLSNYRAFTTGPGTTPTVVPVPAAVWLFGSGLLGLVGLRRRSSLAA